MLDKLPERIPNSGVLKLKLQDYLHTCCHTLQEKFNEYDHAAICREMRMVFIGHECPLLLETAPVSYTATEKAFAVEFNDEHYGLARAVQYFEYCTVHGATGMIYSKSCAIVQSSGSGKSRLMTEIAALIPTLYVCHREDTDQNYPPSTPFIRNFLLEVDTRENVRGKEDLFIFAKSIALYCSAALIVQGLYEKIEVGPSTERWRPAGHLRDFLELQRKGEFWGKFESVLRAVTDDAFNELLGALKTTLPDDSSRPSASWAQLEERMTPFVQSYTWRLPRMEASSHLRLIICIDEARHFLQRPSHCTHELLVHLNRAMRCADPGILLVFMDTLSDVNVLNPVKAFPSERIKFSGHQQLVFTDILTWDLGGDREIRYLEQTVKPEVQCWFGRPIWAATLAASGKWEDVQQLAIAKLTGNIVSIKHEQMNVRTVLAVMASRVGLDINSGVSLTNDLVGSHLAHLDYFDADTSQASVSYPSDPTVAEAAATITRDPKQFSQAVQRIAEMTRSNIVKPGERGEITAQLLCLRAIDWASQGNREYCPTVREFLDALFMARQCDSLDIPDDSGSDSEIAEALEGLDIAPDLDWAQGIDVEGLADILNARLNFNHFFRIAQYTPTRADLVNFVKTRAAVACKENQHGIDMLLPVIMPKAVGESVKETEVRLGKPHPSAFLATGAGIEITPKPARLATEGLAAQAGERICALLLDEERRRTTPPSTPIPMPEPSASASSSQQSPYVLDSEHVSYILIQCKNYIGGKPHAKDLPLLRPGRDGAKIEASDDKRPYVALLMSFDNQRAHGLGRLWESRNLDGRAVELHLRNGHRLDESTAPFFNILLKRVPDPLSLAREGEDRLRKAMQCRKYLGTKISDYRIIPHSEEVRPRPFSETSHHSIVQSTEQAPSQPPEVTQPTSIQKRSSDRGQDQKPSPKRRR